MSKELIEKLIKSNQDYVVLATLLTVKKEGDIFIIDDIKSEDFNVIHGYYYEDDDFLTAIENDPDVSKFIQEEGDFYCKILFEHDEDGLYWTFIDAENMNPKQDFPIQELNSLSEDLPF